MLRVDFVTLFPGMMLGPLDQSILKRAVDRGLVEFGIVNPREFAKDAHRTVDDSPYGGGPGMVLMCGPIIEAIRSLQPSRETAIVLCEPNGRLFSQAEAEELAHRPRIIFICGHYEGIDHRIAEQFATHVFSIGDYVLTGGELPAMVMADAVVRLIPGVLGDQDSLKIDSHSDGLLSSPQYTRPDVYEGMSVPDVLLSGDHEAVRAWRRRASLSITRELRPDLFCLATIDKKDLDLLSS